MWLSLMKPMTLRPVSSSISRLTSDLMTICHFLRRSRTALPSPASARLRSPLVSVSWRTTNTPFSPRVVFAFVGPRPVVRESAPTTALEIEAARTPWCDSEPSSGSIGRGGSGGMGALPLRNRRAPVELEPGQSRRFDRHSPACRQLIDQVKPPVRIDGRARRSPKGHEPVALIADLYSNQIVPDPDVQAPHAAPRGARALDALVDQLGHQERRDLGLGIV